MRASAYRAHKRFRDSAQSEPTIPSAPIRSCRGLSRFQTWMSRRAGQIGEFGLVAFRRGCADALPVARAERGLERLSRATIAMVSSAPGPESDSKLRQLEHEISRSLAGQHVNDCPDSAGPELERGGVGVPSGVGGDQHPGVAQKSIIRRWRLVDQDV